MGLILHAGAAAVDRSAIASVHTPEGTDSWRPIPHESLVRMVEQFVEQAGLSISDSSFALTKDGKRMFGCITIGGGTDYATVFGLRNSHDKSFAGALCLGSRVFVCDNLAFSSEIVIKAKHTSRVLDRLPRIVGSGIASLIERRGNQAKRIEAYREAPVTGQAHLHDLTLRAYRANAIPARAIAEVLNEFDAPRHDEFKARTVWSFFNACTEVLKEYGDLTHRTQRLHTVVDAECSSTLLAV